MARQRTEFRRVNMNLTVAQYEKYEAAAAEAGVSFTRYVQQALWLKSKIDEEGYQLVDSEGLAHHFIFSEAV